MWVRALGGEFPLVAGRVYILVCVDVFVAILFASFCVYRNHLSDACMLVIYVHGHSLIEIMSFPKCKSLPFCTCAIFVIIHTRALSPPSPTPFFHHPQIRT